MATLGKSPITIVPLCKEWERFSVLIMARSGKKVHTGSSKDQDRLGKNIGAFSLP